MQSAGHDTAEAVGFWQARSPGHGAVDIEGSDWHALRIATANTTSWPSLQKFLLTTDADVVLAQEHRLPPCRVPEASEWARRHNWHAMIIPAASTEAGGWSGGVAVIARPHAALSSPRIGSETIAEARIVAANIEPPGHRPTLVVSAYLQDGVGLAPVNLKHLADIGTCIHMHGSNYPFVVGGDFQLQPKELANAGFGDQVGGTLVASGAARGTCRASKYCSELDYFFVQNAFALGVKAVDTIETAGTRPHVPVALTFHPRVTSARALFLRLPQALPVERVYGPVPAEPDWTAIKRRTRQLADDARHCGVDHVFRRRYQEAFSEWADQAEVEIIQFTGHQGPVKRGMRGKEPKLVWRSIVPERVNDPGDDDIGAWRIMAGVATDILRRTAYKLKRQWCRARAHD